jgi:hypothetical protein
MSAENGLDNAGVGCEQGSVLTYATQFTLIVPQKYVLQN